MRRNILTVTLLSGNVALIVANILLARSVAAVSNVASDVRDLRRVQKDIAERLARVAGASAKARSERDRDTEGDPTEPVKTDTSEVQGEEAWDSAIKRKKWPNPMEMPVLPDDEVQELRRFCETFPQLDLAAVREGDIDHILETSAFLPSDRILNEEERGRLRDLASQFQYFAKYSHLQRFHTMVKPNIPVLEEAGAYSEIDGKEGADVVDGVRIAHAEYILEKPGKYNLFRFYPEQWPEMYHHERVCQQQTTRVAAEIYGLVYATSPPAYSGQ